MKFMHLTTIIPSYNLQVRVDRRPGCQADLFVSIASHQKTFLMLNIHDI